MSANQDMLAASTKISHRMGTYVERLHSLEYNQLPILGRPPTEASKPASPLAGKVFVIPELLEGILSNLSFRELLDAMQVNKQFHDTIESSPTLQRRLFLKPDMKADVTAIDSPFPGIATAIDSPFPGIDIELRRSAPERSDEADARMTGCCFTDRPWPTIGARVQRMFITQPPIKEVSICAQCDSCRLEHDVILLAQGEGFTIGEIWKAATALAKRHQDCDPSTVHRNIVRSQRPRWFESSQGCVDFHAYVNLEPTHPKMIQWQEDDREQEETRPLRDANMLHAVGLCRCFNPRSASDCIYLKFLADHNYVDLDVLGLGP